jgi:hypothetical protein
VDGGHDAVLAPRQPPEHVPRLRIVGRLAEDVVVYEDEGVRGEDPVVGVPAGAGRGLLAREPCGCLGPRLSGRNRLVDVGRTDREGDAEVREDLGASGRGGGEDERRYG